MDGGTAKSGGESSDGLVVRRSERGWLVGDEETADLTGAMVLADLLAADLGRQLPARERGLSPRHAKGVRGGWVPPVAGGSGGVVPPGQH